MSTRPLITLTTEYFIQLPHTKRNKNILRRNKIWNKNDCSRSKTRSKHTKGSRERYLLGQKHTPNQSSVFVLRNSVLLSLSCVWIMLWEGLDIPAPFVVVGFIGLLVLPFSWISCPKNNAVLGVFDFPSFCLFVLLRRGCIYLVSLFYFLLAGIKRKKEKRKGRAVFRTVHLCDSYVHVYFPFVSDGFTPPWDSCCRRRWLPVKIFSGHTSEKGTKRRAVSFHLVTTVWIVGHIDRPIIPHRNSVWRSALYVKLRHTFYVKYQASCRTDNVTFLCKSITRVGEKTRHLILSEVGLPVWWSSCRHQLTANICLVAYV